MRTIIYKRVSTDDQADRGFSLQHQETVLKQFCSINNYPIVDVYTEDYSGKDFNRPEWNKIISYLKKNKGKVDQVLCLRWDRWSRNQYLALKEIKTLDKLDVLISTVEQPIDLSSPDSKVLLSIYLTLPEVENDKNSIRTIEGSRRARIEGCWTGSAPRGYSNCRVGVKSTLNPNEAAPYIKECFERMVLGVYSANEVRKYINEQKYPYKGKHFNISKQTFYNIIRNVAYTGKIKVKEYKKEEEQIVIGLHPPIVSDDLFKRANDYLNGRVRKFDFKSDKTDLYPLKGFMKCSEHGRTITAYKCQSGNKNWYHYYLCTKPRCQRYRVDWAHEQIKKLLDKISFTAGMVKVYKSQLESLIDRDDVTRKTEIKRLETEIETCKTRQLNLQNSFLDCGISSSDFNEMKIRIESELNDKQIKLERLKSTKSPFKVYLNKTLPMIENLSHYWDKADGKTKKKILGCIFTEKFENFDFESCNNIFTPEIKSIMLASKVLKSGKKRQEVKNDLLSNMAPPLGLEPRTL